MSADVQPEQAAPAPAATAPVSEAERVEPFTPRALLGLVADKWLRVDTRTLGLFRIGFGLLCIGNLIDRLWGRDEVAFYTNDGLLTNHYSLFAPVAARVWSPLFGFSTLNETRLAMAFVMLVYVLYTLGWKTPVMKWLTWLCVLSVQQRALFMQNGGHVVVHIIALWSAFLPLGERFSLDALLRSLRARREATPGELRERRFLGLVPAARWHLAYLCICADFAGIYWFNAIHKSGGTWREGSAVHYLWWQNRLATTWAALIRMHEPSWLSPVLTWGTLVMEFALPFLILSPWFQKWTRPLAIVFIFALHGGIAISATLGPFSYAMMSFSLILVPTEAWEWLARRRATAARARAFIYDAGSAFCHQVARLLARLDVFGVLEFYGRDEVLRSPELLAAAGRPAPASLPDAPFATLRRDGSVAVDGAMRSDLRRALPLGLFVAWLTGVSASMRAWLSSAFALDRKRGDAEEAPAPWRLGVGKLAHAFSIGAILVIGACVVSQFLMENRAVPPWLKPASRPQAMTDVIDYLKIPQGWSMFAPDTPTGDLTIVVDAELADGSHIDPLTGQPPDFDAPLHGPWGLSMQFGEYLARVEHTPHLWRPFKDYIDRIDELEGWPPQKRIMRFDVWVVTNRSPPIGSTTPTDIQKRLLFASDRI